ERLDALAGIKPLGIELVGDDAALGMDDDLAADQPLAVAGQPALAADEMVLIDPLPGPRLEMAAHPVAVGQIHHQRAARRERPLHRAQHGNVILLAVEIAEGVAEDRDAVKAAVGRAELARVALVEGDAEAALAGTLARQPHQIARAIDAGDVLEAAPRQLQHVPPLTAAQIEDAVIGLEAGASHQQIDLLLGVAVVLDDVAIGLEIERVEERAP